MVTQQFEQRTRELIDSLKAICAAYGLGNDGNEFKIITQVFLYKFLNDKFAFEAKKIRPDLAKAESWEAAMAAMNPDDPRWPGQIPPPLATPNSPRQDRRIMTTRVRRRCVRRPP